MDRSLTNAIRFVMDECLPPLLRDSRWFMRPFYQVAYRGKNVEQAMDFKSLVHEWSQQEYDSFYASLDTISRNRLTDLNRPSLEMVLREVDPGASTLLDVGCANGHLLRQIGRRHPHLALTGLDVRPDLPAAPFTYVRGHARTCRSRTTPSTSSRAPTPSSTCSTSGERSPSSSAWPDGS